jgi:hypothetical protein
MQSIERINADLRAIWKQYPADRGRYSPMQYRKPKKGCLMFVGMNPSFSSKGWKGLLKHAKRPTLNPHQFFRWPSPRHFDDELAHELEVIAREHYQFFDPHRKLFNQLRRHWDHIDLFAYRETSQKKVQSGLLASANNKDVTLSEFGLAQFNVFWRLLNLAKPCAVVVVNALAARIYVNQRSLEFNHEHGYYSDTVGDHSFPVFLSGMLTGGRALDRFSKERLFWQIGKALDE